MEAHESDFLFLSVTHRFFEVPFFQRGYVWEEDNWKDLWDDLNDDNSNHFLGSIIIRDNGSNTYSIVDGQQRITTISILLKVCYEALIKNTDDETKAVYTSLIGNMIFHSTFDEFNKPIRKTVVKHSIVDAPNFEKVILNDLTSDEINGITLDSEMVKEKNQKHIGKSSDNNILKCYKYYKLKVGDDKNLAKKLADLITNEKNKMVVKIDLDAAENEQAIFDTINTAGVRLSCADTIKNSIFQKAMENAKNDEERNYIKSFYKNMWENTFASSEDDIAYWNTEIQVGRYKRNNLEILFQSIALIYGIYDPEKHALYKLTDLYKEYLKNKVAKCIKEELSPIYFVTGFVSEIVGYAKIYRSFFYSLDEKSAYTYDDDIKRLFNILNACNISALHPYILKILKDADLKEAEPLKDELKKKLKAIEVYVIRSLICGVSVSNFNKECPILIRGEKTIEDYIEEKKLTEESVAQGIKTIKNNNVGRVILFWVELYKQYLDKKEDTKALFFLTYTLEHIMPVTWERYWGIDKVPVYDSKGRQIKKAEDAEAARNSAIFEIGNMALLTGSLNSAISNYDIERKIHGAPNAKLKDTKGIKDYATLVTTRNVVDEYEKELFWDERSIAKRTAEITSVVNTMWSIE